MPARSRPILAASPLLDTTDLDVARTVTGQAWGKHASEVIGRDPYRLRLNRVAGERVPVTAVDCTARIDTRLEGGHDLQACRWQLIIPLCGGIDITIDGTLLSAAPGSAVLVRCSRSMRFVASPTRCLMVDCADGTIDERVSPSEKSLRTPVGWRLTGMAGRRVVSEAIGLTRLHDRLGPSSGAVGPASRVALAEASLLARIGDFLTGHSFPPSTTAPCERLVVEDHLQWLSDHCRVAVSIEDLALHAGVSARAVEQSFARHVGATPSECLRSMRLELAHRLLEQASDGATVTTVALDAGFTHLGRFSADYRHRFGQLPSETLARRGATPIRTSESGYRRDDSIG